MGEWKVPRKALVVRGDQFAIFGFADLLELVGTQLKYYLQGYKGRRL